MFNSPKQDHSPVIEELATVLASKLQNPNVAFFRVIVVYFLCKMAASMRVTVTTPDRGTMPSNAFCLLTAPSGTGKNYSMDIMREEILAGFQDAFLQEVFPDLARDSLHALAQEREIANGTNYKEELGKARKEYDGCGDYLMEFDSGTIAGAKQVYHKLLMAKVGSLNLEIDEIGSNLATAAEILTLYLELYDKGHVKPKLLKHSNDNKRVASIEGWCPANLLMFGTPSDLFDGGKTEEAINAFWQTGYGRRCFYGEANQAAVDESKSAEDLFDLLVKQDTTMVMDKWANHFEDLAIVSNVDWNVNVPDDVAIRGIEYRMYCEKRAAKLPEHADLAKTELIHRYSKGLKLAATLAFIDGCEEMQMDHLMYAFKVAEESGEAFEKMRNREKNYVRLAKYIASEDGALTHADIMERLPFYKGSNTARNELMMLAIAWAYKNHIVIRNYYSDGIEFFSGEALEETNLDELIFAFSTGKGFNYQNTTAEFDKLEDLTQISGMNYTNHYMVDGDEGNGRRELENIEDGFNCIILDIDGTCPLDVVWEVLEKYKFHVYTTKSHTEEEERFRIVLPMKYILKMDEEDFREFMDNISDWLPFEYDFSANQRNRKWASCNGWFDYNDDPDTTELFDPLQFIPRTTKNEAFRETLQKLSNHDSVERWFVHNMRVGSRNNMLFRFGSMLADCGSSEQEAQEAILRFNKKLANGLDESEIKQTIFVSLKKHYASKPID